MFDRQAITPSPNEFTALPAGRNADDPSNLSTTVISEDKERLILRSIYRVLFGGIDPAGNVVIGRYFHFYSNYRLSFIALQLFDPGPTDIYYYQQPQNFLGWIVGEDRGGRSQQIYNTRIQARALLNRSKGRPDDLLLLLRLISPADAKLTLHEYQSEYSAQYEIELLTDTDISAVVQEIVSVMHLAKPAGVNGTLRVTQTDGLLLDDLGSPDGLSADIYGLASDTSQSDGGYLATIY